MRAGLALAVALGGSAAVAECRDDRLTIQGGFGKASFHVQVADDEAERARGLMEVSSMATLAGMLFVYDQPQATSFWMENTLIPLDMLFSDETGAITAIHPDAVPLDRTPIPGGDAVQFVVEINGGLAARLGIAVGDIIQHPSIGPGAALPCP